MNSILIVQYSANLDGSSYSALILADGLRAAGWTTNILFGFEGAIVPKFIQHGHNVLVLPHKNWLRNRSTFRFLKDISFEGLKVPNFIHLFRRLKPDIIYVNTLVSLSAVLAASYIRIPIIWHIRELFSDVGGEMQVNYASRNVARLIVNRLSKEIIVNSSAVKDNILGQTKRNIHIIPNAIQDSFFSNDLDRINSRHILQLPVSPRIIGVPGTLRPMKGHPFFIESIAPILKYQEDIIVAITGDGDKSYVELLKSLVDQLGIEDKVRFLGRVNDMKPFYTACNIVVIPSRAEPFGRVIIEAFAARTPVIATKVGGIPEIIDDNRNGKLVEYGNTIQLREAVNSLLQNAEIAESFINQGLSDAQSLYTERIYKNRIIKVCNAVI